MYVLVIYALLGAAVVYSSFLKQKWNLKLEWTVYGAAALIFLFRFSLGQDISRYASLFYSVKNPFSDAVTSHMMRNVVYTLLNYVVKITTGEFRWFVFLSNILILALCTYVIYRHSKKPILSMMLFVGSGMLEVYYGSGLRQGLAIAVFLYAYYEFLPKKQYLRYELFCLLALGFHDLSVVLFPVPLFFLLIKWFKTHPYLVTAGLTAVSWGLLWIVYEFAETVEWMIIDRVGFAPVWTHMLAYLHDHEFSLIGIAMEAVFLVGIMTLYYLADTENWSDFSRFEVLTFVYSTSLYFACACYPLMSRGSDMIQIIMLVLIPELFASMPDLRRKAVSFLALFALNGFILFVDLREKCRIVNEVDKLSLTIERFPYIPVFDKQRIDQLHYEE